jgi:hypothetical protein
MQKMLTILLIVCAVKAEAQFRIADREIPFVCDNLNSKPLRWRKLTPTLVTFPGSEVQSAFSYWQGSSYTSYSGNGRIRSTHLFDVQGQLRESRASISLRRKGILSNWRVQFSPQRTSPLFIYMIQ